MRRLVTTVSSGSTLFAKVCVLVWSAGLKRLKVMVSIHKQKLYNVFIERILSKYKSNSDTVNLHLIEQIIKLDKIVEKLTQYEIDFFSGRSSEIIILQVPWYLKCWGHIEYYDYPKYSGIIIYYPVNKSVCVYKVRLADGKQCRPWSYCYSRDSKHHCMHYQLVR